MLFLIAIVTGKRRGGSRAKIIPNGGVDNNWSSQISDLLEVNYYILRGVSLSRGLGGFGRGNASSRRGGLMVVERTIIVGFYSGFDLF